MYKYMYVRVHFELRQQLQYVQRSGIIKLQCFNSPCIIVVGGGVARSATSRRHASGVVADGVVGDLGHDVAQVGRHGGDGARAHDWRAGSVRCTHHRDFSESKTKTDKK